MWHDPMSSEPSSFGESLLVRREAFATTMATPQRHHQIEFNLVLGGTATYVLTNRRYELAPNTLVWLFPGQDHLMIHRSPDYRDWIGLVRRDELVGWCTSGHTAPLLEPDPPGDHVCTLSAAAAARLDTLLRLVATGSPEAVAAGRVAAALSAWDAYLAADRPVEPALVHPAVNAAMTLLSATHGPADLPSLAARVNLSPSHLSRIFLRETGVSISRFRNEQRVRRFFALRDEAPAASILDLAIEAGFGSAAQFHRVFKELTGATPGAHCRSVR